jgi:signal-transduction protein with cAMP-binding, CBS, and nucleotidyltransferase domain
VKLQEIMVGDVVQISPAGTVGEAAKLMREKFVGSLVATIDDGVIKGIITDRDLLACLHQKHDPYQCKIALHMSRPVVVLRPEEDHITAVNVMRQKRIKRLPVASRGKLLGIVSLSDLASIAEPEVERIKSSGLFLSALIRTEGAQKQATQPRIRMESEKETKAKEELAFIL